MTETRREPVPAETHPGPSEQRAEPTSDDEQRWLRVLWQATAAVNATEDVRQALQRVTDVLVPDVADAAAVWLVEGALTDVAHPPALLPVDAVPPAPGQLRLVAQSVPVGSPADDETSPLPSVEEWARRVGGHSLLTVPLTHEDQEIGVLALSACAGRVAYRRIDRAYGGQLAARITHALDRAASYRNYRAMALTLQRSMLPSLHPPLDEIEVAARYVPAAEGAEVGGDWYDVIPLGAGRIGLVIGDVMGHGIGAAAVMGQLRTAMRAYARLDVPGVQLLNLLDALVHDLNPNQIVTLAYAVYDPGTGELRVVNAGHPPPLLADRDGVRVLIEDQAPPLGLQAAAYREHRTTLKPGDVLALYTDGLIEVPRQSLAEGIGEVADLLADPDGDLEALADRVLGQRQGAGRDDVALLLVRVPPAELTGAPQTTCLSLSRKMPAARVARQHALDFLQLWELDSQTTEAAVLLITELVTNAIKHGTDPVELRLRRASRCLVIEVSDTSRQWPQRHHPDEISEYGHGLEVVAALAERWGCRPTPEGKAVWCELSLPTGGVRAR